MTKEKDNQESITGMTVACSTHSSSSLCGTPADTALSPVCPNRLVIDSGSDELETQLNCSEDQSKDDMKVGLEEDILENPQLVRKVRASARIKGAVPVLQRRHKLRRNRTEGIGNATSTSCFYQEQDEHLCCGACPQQAASSKVDHALRLSSKQKHGKSSTMISSRFNLLSGIALLAYFSTAFDFLSLLAASSSQHSTLDFEQRHSWFSPDIRFHLLPVVSASSDADFYRDVISPRQHHLAYSRLLANDDENAAAAVEEIGFDGISVMPTSCFMYGNGHMIKFQLFENSNSYQCHFKNLGTFVVSIAHFMRAYFNYQALTLGNEFNLPQDAAYLNCVMLQESQYMKQKLYAKIGCMERETFTSTKLQLHIYKDKQCTQQVDSQSSAGGTRYGKGGYSIDGYWLSNKVSFRPDFYKCIKCSPEQIADTFNKGRNWYDDDYINSGGKKNNDDGEEGKEEEEEEQEDVSENDDGSTSYNSFVDDQFRMHDDHYYNDMVNDDFYAARVDDDKYNNGYNNGYSNSNQGDDAYFEMNDDNTSFGSGSNNNDDMGSGSGNDDASSGMDDGSWSGSGVSGNADDGSGSSNAGDDFSGNDDDDYYDNGDDFSRRLRTLSVADATVEEYQRRFWLEVGEMRRSLQNYNYYKNNKNGGGGIGDWNFCQRLHKYGMWCDDECKALDSFRSDEWSNSDIFLLVIMCVFMAAMMLLVFAKRVKAYEKASIYGDEGLDGASPYYPGLPPMAMVLVFISLMAIILIMANLKLVNETLVFAVITCILLFIYMLKLTLFENRGPRLLPASNMPGSPTTAFDSMNKEMFR